MGGFFVNMKEQCSQLPEQNVWTKQVGWLGPKGTFTEKAAEAWQLRSGNTTELAQGYSPNIISIFKGVIAGRLDLGIVPIENTIGGPVKDTHAALEEQDGFTIIGEVVLPIQQYFYCQDRKKVTTIASKDQALAQVEKWVEKNYPQAKKVEVNSTALAVQMATEDPTIGAIAGADAADELGLKKDKLKRTEESIEDNKANATTFVVIAKTSELSEPTGNDKTTLILELPNVAGSLYSVLAELAEKGINLTKIKSLRGFDGKIRFLVSVDGHQKDEKVSAALLQLSQKGAKLKPLGSYPKDNYVPKHKIEPNMKNAISMIEKETKNGDANNKDNAIVVFNLPNQVGALADVLRIFADRNINLTKIDSMPSGNFEEYIFYLSFNRNDVKDEGGLYRELADCSGNIVQLQ